MNVRKYINQHPVNLNCTGAFLTIDMVCNHIFFIKLLNSTFLIIANLHLHGNLCFLYGGMGSDLIPKHLYRNCTYR